MIGIQMQEYVDKILSKTAFHYHQVYGLPPEIFLGELKGQEFSSTQLYLLCKLFQKEYKITI